MRDIRITRLLSSFLLIAGSAYGLWAQAPGDIVPKQDGSTPSGLDSPSWPAEAPPNPPQVVCAGDQLTITADNSTMGSILVGLKNCLGIDAQIPKGFAEERTFVKLGPGPTRSILDDLLGGTSFNYVIESSAPDHGKILAIVLTDRTTETSQIRDGIAALPSAGLAMTPARRPGPTNSNAARPVSPTPETEEPSASADEKEDPPKMTESQVAAAPVGSNAPIARPDGANPTDHDQDFKSLAGFPSVQSGPTIPAISEPQSAAPAAMATTPDQNHDNQVTKEPPLPAVSDPQTASPAVDASPTPDQMRDKQITQMQQMFEERKNLIASPTAPVTPPPPPVD